MLTSVFKFLLHEYRTQPMARFAFWVMACGVVLALLDWFGAGLPPLLWTLLWMAGIVAGVYYSIRLVRVFQERVLWRLRRRLMVAYLFIAVVPIILILVLVAIGAIILNGQFAAFLVTLKMRDQMEELQQVNRVVAHEAHLTTARTPEGLLDQLGRFYSQELYQHVASYPGLEVTLLLGNKTRAFHLNGTLLQPPVVIPAWLKNEEFSSSVLDKGKLYLRSVDQLATPVGRLTLVLTEPLSSELLDLVGTGIGPVGIVLPAAGGAPLSGSGDSGLPVAAPAFQYQEEAVLRSNVITVPQPANFLDATVFGVSTLDPVVWGGDREEKLAQPVLVFVTSRFWTLNRQLLGTLGRYSRVYLALFVIVAFVFLAIELVALITGIRLTRSITGTVDNLYDATERVRKGELSYRINLPARDQLSALGEAFDSMTASVERLLRESQEKLRLENELEIAREVQRQLFPRSIPDVRGLELYGACLPARGVSGDYYDFLKLGQNQVAIVLGDVSGKGISAALLMAAIQSAVRAQLYNLTLGEETAQDAHFSTAEVVRRLNRQLFETTPLEKYATFFYAVYDAPSQKMTYTNAGHPPPMLFRRNGIERLGVGGTAVGLFLDAEFEEAEVRVEPGDLFLAFTDGITEPENSYEEEFGEDRVIETVQKERNNAPAVLAAELYRTINDWTGSPELQDDMTLILARSSG